MNARQPPSPLARAAAGKVATPTESALRRAFSGSRPFEPWQIPRLGLDVEITLVGYADQERIEGEVFERMRELKLELSLTTENIFEAARAARTLAVAFVTPKTHEPVGSVEDFVALDETILGVCWRRYGEVRTMHDPITQPLTAEQLAEIALAVKKKDPTLLRFFGAHALASYLLTLDEQPAISPIPKSGTSESLPAS